MVPVHIPNFISNHSCPCLLYSTYTDLPGTYMISFQFLETCQNFSPPQGFCICGSLSQNTFLLVLCLTNFSNSKVSLYVTSSKIPSQAVLYVVSSSEIHSLAALHMSVPPLSTNVASSFSSLELITICNYIFYFLLSISITKTISSKVAGTIFVLIINVYLANTRQSIKTYWINENLESANMSISIKYSSFYLMQG